MTDARYTALAVQSGISSAQYISTLTRTNVCLSLVLPPAKIASAREIVRAPGKIDPHRFFEFSESITDSEFSTLRTVVCIQLYIIGTHKYTFPILYIYTVSLIFDYSNRSFGSEVKIVDAVGTICTIGIMRF